MIDKENSESGSAENESEEEEEEEEAHSDNDEAIESETFEGTDEFLGETAITIKEDEVGVGSDLYDYEEEDAERERRRQVNMELEKTRLKREQRLREPHLRKKMVFTEPATGWEFATNQFASQKGSGGFGTIRNTVTSVHSSKALSEGTPGSVPFLNCPQLKTSIASQAGMKPFGAIREQVTHVVEKNEGRKKRCNELLRNPKETESILKLWSQPNPEAKNDHLYGSTRPTVIAPVGGRQWTAKELADSRASVPRFNRVNETCAKRNDADNGTTSQVITGFFPRRQVVTPVVGATRTIDDQLNSNKYNSWLGGKLSLQSQSRLGGFMSPRDVVNSSFYARMLSEKDLSPAELYALREKEQQRRKKWSEFGDSDKRRQQSAEGDRFVSQKAVGDGLDDSNRRRRSLAAADGENSTESAPPPSEDCTVFVSIKCN